MAKISGGLILYKLEDNDSTSKYWLLILVGHFSKIGIKAGGPSPKGNPILGGYFPGGIEGI